jgi:RHS repeat-associated protein
MSRLASLFSAITHCLFALFLLLVSTVVYSGSFTDVGTALTTPASSSTGNYTVTFKTSALGTHYLQQKTNTGNWANVGTYVTAPNGTANYPSVTRNKPFSGKTTGTYSYRVYFVPPEASPVVSGGYSNTKITVVSLVPGAPSIISTSSIQGNNASFTVNWGTSSGTVNSYELEQQLDGGAWGQVYSGIGISQAYSGLADGSYNYRVKACNSIGCSSYRTASSAYVVASPTSSTTSAIHSIRKSHKIDWAASSGNFDAYQLYSKFNDDNWTLAYEGLDLSATFTDLADGHYQYWVRACNTEGSITTCSDYQASDRLTLSYVDIPTDLTVPTGDADGIYTINWQPGQGTATTYTLQEKTNGGAWATVQDTSDTSYIVSGKTNNQYSYQVRGCNLGGCTDYTAAQIIEVKMVGQPGVITGPDTLQEVDDFTLAWGTASGTVTYYELEEQASGESWNPVYSGANLTESFTDHNFGTYNYRARACNDIACGSYTSDKTVSITFTIPPQTPPAPFDVASNLTDLVSQTEIDATDTVGSVGGSFRVDESGAATYSVPIATVKGTAGVVPQISLNYSSQAGNGLMGKGWSIGGLSAVTRCRQTLSQDKSAKAITWSAGDRFCLDGQRLLIETGANYGAVGATYKTEIDSFAKVTSVGGTNGHPDYFTVERKDGSISTYGGIGDIDAEQVARNDNGSVTTKTLTWALDRFEDSVGNPIEFDYIDDTGGHRIDRIKYAYGLGSSHGAHVDFLYEARDDDISGYVAGYQFVNNRRLKTIKSYNGTNAVREYNLVYASVTSSNNKTSRLDSIEECIAANCLPKTDFTWSMPQTGFASSASGSINLSPRSDRGVFDYKPADINGDGLMDVVWLEWGQDGTDTDYYLKYALSNGTNLVNATFSNGAGQITYGEDVTSTDERVRFEIIDYNGDGRQDVIFFNTRNGGKWRVRLSLPQANGTWKLSSGTIDTGETDDVYTYDKTQFTDVNSDGLTDIVYRAYDGSRQYRHIYVRHLSPDTSQSSGSSRPYKFNSRISLGKYLLLDPNLVPFLAMDGTPIHVTEANIGNQADWFMSLHPAGDLNGDGNSDIQVNDPFIYGTFIRTRDQLYRSLNLDKNSFSYFVKDDYYRSNQLTNSTSQDPQVRSKFKFSDFNGDGLSDVISYDQVPNQTAGWYLRLSKGEGFANKVLISGITGYSAVVPFILQDDGGNSVQLVDVNNDGHPDFVWHDKNAQQMKARLWNVSSNNFTTTINLRSTNGNDSNGRLFIDMNGDGVLDYVLFSGNTLKTYPGNVTDDVAYLVTSITSGLGAETEITYTSLADDNHYQTWGYNQPDSLFGVYNKTSSSAFYTALHDAWNPTLPAGSETLDILSPVLEFSAPTQVVARVDSSAPKAGASPGAINTSAMSAISYYYGEARLQAAGRGFLGFERIKTKDEQTGVETTTTYRQDWPFIGHPLKTEVRTAQGHLLSEAENTWKLKGYSSAWGTTAKNNGTSALGALQPYIHQSVEQTYALENDGTQAGALLQTVTTDNVYDDYGNPTNITVTTNGGPVGNDKNFQKVTSNTYLASGLDSTYSQEKGRLSETTVVSKRDEDGDTSYELSSTRTSTFSYHTSGYLEGLLASETIEPNNALLTLTTTHSYDSFGNKIRAATTDANSNTRCDVDTALSDTLGRYVDTNYDCLGRTVSHVESRNEYGEPLEVKTYLDSTGTNSVSTYYAYTPRGIRYLEGSDAGAWKATTLSDCSGGGSCPTGAVYYAKVTAAGGGESREYFDVLGRSVLEASVGFDGQWIYANSEYDNLGRVKRKSEPYYSGSSASHWSTMTYDIVGRVTNLTLPDGSVGTTAYNGYTTITTNDLSHSKTEIKNTLGETIQVTDNLGGDAYYYYDAQGNMTSMVDDDSNTSTITYDILGRKIAMNDPDKGAWSYDYNGFGELIEQTDAKLQKSVMTYDTLGRMKTRIDRTATSLVEGSTTWNYDTAPNGLGQLDSVEDTISGYLKAVEYDSLGRTSKTVTSLGILGADGDHYEKVTYDQYGRTHQVFDAARNDDTYTDNGIVTLYNQYGYQHQLGDATYTNDQPRSIYQEVLAMNARGQVTSEKLGNNATTARTYDDQTGRVQSILATTMLGTSGDIQDLSYQWDTVGNLSHRKEQSGNKDLTENFGYDGLNRLTSYHVVGQTAKTISYDLLGNITNKSDVGTYTYGANAGPHAVTSAGGTTYIYDDNGNNTSSSDGRTIAYTTFDKAKTVTKGAHTTTFAYGADRARYKRTDTNASGTKTTLYIGAVEKITNVNGSKQVKRTIGGVAIITLNQNSQGVTQSTDTNYLYKDHLGSLDIITDATGAIVTNGGEMSFDAFGQRRDAINWQDMSSSVITAGFGVFSNSGLGPVTTRGYTGHEMADEVGIIHMNGRIYDPKLGRFLQADPFVQEPHWTQSLNRYSYGFNNPLNGTDPSGYIFGIDDLFVAIAVYAVSTIAAKADIPLLSTVANIVGCAYGYCTASSFGNGYGSTGSFSAGLKAGAMSYLAEVAFGQIGDKFNGSGFFAEGGLGHIGTHAFAGGVMSELQGGKFGHGFFSAGVLKAFSPTISKVDGIMVNGKSVAQALVAATVGGTLSELSGGKFAKGAITGAFSNLFNQQSFKKSATKIIAKVGDSAFIFDGITEGSACQGVLSCIRELRSTPQHMGMSKLAPGSEYYVSTQTKTYGAYTDAIGAHAADQVGTTANVLTVFCPECAPVTAPISLIASAAKFYFEPSVENALTPLAGNLGGKLLYKSGRLTAGQAAAGGAAVELGSGLANETQQD